MGLSLPASTKVELKTGQKWVALPAAGAKVYGGEYIGKAPDGERTDTVVSVSLSTWLPEHHDGKAKLRMELTSGAVIVHSGEVIGTSESELRFKVESTSRSDTVGQMFIRYQFADGRTVGAWTPLNVDDYFDAEYRLAVIEDMPRRLPDFEERAGGAKPMGTHFADDSNMGWQGELDPIPVRS